MSSVRHFLPHMNESEKLSKSMDIIEDFEIQIDESHPEMVKKFSAVDALNKLVLIPYKRYERDMPIEDIVTITEAVRASGEYWYALITHILDVGDEQCADLINAYRTKEYLLGGVKPWR